jgi:hypothetical protein
MLKTKYFSIALLIIFCNANSIYAQCCALGNTSTNHSTAGILPKNTLGFYANYKTGENETYFRQNIKLINYGIHESSGFDFSSIQLAYGITDKLTIEHEAGYFLRKELVFYNEALNDLIEKGSGLSNGTIGLKYLAYSSTQNNFDLVGGVGLKYPFSQEMKSINGVELPMEIQPSTRSWGWTAQVIAGKKFSTSDVSILISHKYESNFADLRNYKYGSLNTTNLSVSKGFFNKLNVMLSLRNEYKNTDKTPTGAKLASEGSNLVILSTYLNYQFFKNYSLFTYVDLPAYKYYFGEQISMKYAFGVGLSGNLNLN